MGPTSQAAPGSRRWGPVKPSVLMTEPDRVSGSRAQLLVGTRRHWPQGRQADCCWSGFLWGLLGVGCAFRPSRADHEGLPRKTRGPVPWVVREDGSATDCGTVVSSGNY